MELWQIGVQLSLLQSAMNSCYKFGSLQSAMELWQITTTYFIAKCNEQLLWQKFWQISYKVWHGLNCDKYCIVRWIYYKLRKVLPSARIIRTMITNVHAYYYTIKFWCTFPIISINWPLTPPPCPPYPVDYESLTEPRSPSVLPTSVTCDHCQSKVLHEVHTLASMKMKHSSILSLPTGK